MKRLIIATPLLFFFISCYTQWSTRGTVEISAGGVFPIGEFSYPTFDYEGSGFAVPGLSLAVSFNYRVNAHLGLVASVSEYLPGVDESNVAKKYWTPGIPLNWEVESACWKSCAFMGGIDVILPVYRSDFNFRLVGGFARTRLPGLTGNAFDFQREASTEVAAAWSAGAGYTYQYAKKITLSLRLDFFITNPVLEDNWSSDLGSGSGKIAQHISIINLTAGLGFRIF